MSANFKKNDGDKKVFALALKKKVWNIKDLLKLILGYFSGGHAHTGHISSSADHSDLAGFGLGPANNPGLQNNSSHSAAAAAATASTTATATTAPSTDRHSTSTCRAAASAQLVHRRLELADRGGHAAAGQLLGEAAGKKIFPQRHREALSPLHQRQDP